MTLSDLSIRRPVFAWMLMAASIIFGGIAFTRLGVSQLPDITPPVITVSASWAGAAPEVMETEIVDRLEEAVISVQGLKNIESTVLLGQARLKLEFQTDRNIDAALQEVNAKVRAVTLPTDADPPTLSKFNQDDSPILWLGVTWKGHSLHDLTEYVELHLKDQFQVVPGIGDIQLGGWSNRSLRVWADANKLSHYQLTILDLRDSLRLDNQETASGYLENPLSQKNVRTMGEGRTAEQIANIRISSRGGQQIIDSKIRVGDVATVKDDLDDIRRFSRADGVSSIGLGVRKQRGYNSIEVSDNVRTVMQQIRKTLPPGMDLSFRFDSTKFTRDSVRETEFTLLLSALVTALVCWAFLGSWSSTLNVLFSIPNSVLGTFIILYFCGFTLNFFTLLGLSLAIGIVVDDAIMVLENIVRHFHMGKNNVEASLVGAREITFAATATTLSIVAIFSPVFFIGGTYGGFLYQFGVTISCAVLFSLLEAITLIPMRCSQFMQRKEDQNRFTVWVDHLFESCAARYAALLEIALRHRWKVTGLSLLLFLVSLGILPFLRKELSPPQDIGAVMLRVQAPVGSSLPYTGSKVQLLEKALAGKPWIEKTFSNVGGYAGGEVNTGNIFVTLVPRDKRSLSQQDIVTQLRADFKKIKGLKVQVIDMNQAAFSTKRGTDIELSLQGQSYQVLRDKSDEIIKSLDATGHFTDLDTDFREGAKELQITPDRTRAAASGVTTQSIAETVGAAIGGIRSGKFTNDDRRYDLRLRLQPEQWQTPEDVAKLMVRTDAGEIIPLSEVTQSKMVSTLLTITRENRQRAITLFANIKPGLSQEKALNEAMELCRKILPEGYSVVATGASQTNRESFAAFPITLGLGFVVAYMILAAQFNSFIHPLSVLLALPFTITGAFLSLLLTNHSLNLYSAIGIILLMGIAKKNSILLVEFFNKKRSEDGMDVHAAILHGAPIRLRPIFMTSAATVAAAVPAALGLGPGAEVRVPLAIVVIGGVIISTAFSLFVIPCVYCLFTAWESKRSFLRTGFPIPTSPPHPGPQPN